MVLLSNSLEEVVTGLYLYWFRGWLMSLLLQHYLLPKGTGECLYSDFEPGTLASMVDASMWEISCPFMGEDVVLLVRCITELQSSRNFNIANFVSFASFISILPTYFEFHHLYNLLIPANQNFPYITGIIYGEIADAKLKFHWRDRCLAN